MSRQTQKCDRATLFEILTVTAENRPFFAFCRGEQRSSGTFGFFSLHSYDCLCPERVCAPAEAAGDQKHGR